jgi:adenylate cyclase
MTKIERPERRLAAILFADVAGYSRLMGENDLGTLDILTAHRAVFDAVVAEHDGRVVNAAGDSVLAEFKSAIAAVECAVAAQERLAAASALLEESIRLQFRIGVHVGDVLVRGGDLYGDGVNIAARLQALAAPGGICISAVAHDHVRKSLPLAFTALPAQRLKNIEEPVRAYAVNGLRAASRADDTSDALEAKRRADRPSIAVLPFANLSGDVEQEYLADGITDDIIIALTKARWLFVMARNSVFTFKGKSATVEDIGQKLGVRYVLTGGLRRSGSHFRVSAQLVEAATGESLWAERYDRDTNDIFALQDDIVEAVAGAMEPELLKREGARGRARAQSLTSWDLVRRAMWEFHKFRPNSHERACLLCQHAIEIDPESPDAYIWLARALGGMGAYGWTKDPEQTRREGMAAAAKAVQLADKNPYAHYATAVTHLIARNLETALRAAQHAKAINPSFALAFLITGAIHLAAGRADEAIGNLEHGLKMSPFDPQGFVWMFFLSVACYVSGDTEKGLEAAEQALDLRPDWSPALKLEALCCLARRDDDQARALLARIPASDNDVDLSALLMKAGWAEQIEQSLALARDRLF